MDYAVAGAQHDTLAALGPASSLDARGDTLRAPGRPKHRGGRLENAFARFQPARTLEGLHLLPRGRRGKQAPAVGWQACANSARPATRAELGWAKELRARLHLRPQDCQFVGVKGGKPAGSAAWRRADGRAHGLGRGGWAAERLPSIGAARPGCQMEGRTEARAEWAHRLRRAAALTCCRPATSGREQSAGSPLQIEEAPPPLPPSQLGRISMKSSRVFAASNSAKTFPRIASGGGGQIGSHTSSPRPPTGGLRDRTRTNQQWPR